MPKNGKWKGSTEQRDGILSYIMLNFIAYIPTIFVNLFSITQALQGGSNLYNKKEVIYVKKGQITISFDYIANTQNRFIAGVLMHPMLQQVATLAKSKFTYQRVYQILGHIADKSL